MGLVASPLDAQQAGDDADLADMLVGMGQAEVHQALAFGPACVGCDQFIGVRVGKPFIYNNFLNMFAWYRGGQIFQVELADNLGAVRSRTALE